MAICTVKELEELIKLGYNQNEIAKKLNCCVQSVSRMCNKHNLNVCLNGAKY